MITLRSARLEEDRHHALLDLALDDAGVAREEPEHAVILAEHEGPEAREAALGPARTTSSRSTAPSSSPLEPSSDPVGHGSPLPHFLLRLPM
jgi:hypothetical protein